MSVLSGNEKIVRVKIDKDDDLTITTSDGKGTYHWEIGFGEEGNEEDFE